MKNKRVITSIIIFFISLPVLSNWLQAKVAFGLKKVLEFSDDSEGFYFKYPDDPYNRQIEVDPEGYIYIQDTNRILKFDKSGRFITNLVKEGQGPGEVTKMQKFIIHNDEVIIYNHFVDKIIIKDKSGKLIKEFCIEKYLDDLFAVYDDKYYSFNRELPNGNIKTAKIIDINWNIIQVSAAGKIEKDKASNFPIKTFLIKKDGHSSEIGIGELLFARFKDNYFFVTHSTEYEIKLVDIKKKKSIKTFKRDYKRQEPPEEIAKRLNRQAFMFIDKFYHRPPQKYLNDIQQLLVYKDSLWVVTSTVDAKKGVLVDVYNNKCEYSGNFYLKLSDRLSYLDYFSFYAYIFGDFLYIIERDKEDNPWLVKYRIER